MGAPDRDEDFILVVALGLFGTARTKNSSTEER
jgi:hypothetical protein